MKCKKKIKTPKDRSGFALIKPITKDSMWRGGPKPWWLLGNVPGVWDWPLGAQVTQRRSSQLGDWSRGQGGCPERTLSLQGPRPGWARGLEPPGTAGGSLVALDLQGPFQPKPLRDSTILRSLLGLSKTKVELSLCAEKFTKIPQTNEGKKKSFKIDF